jgi:hypothetical protein
VCNTPFTLRRPNSCQRCYFKKRHQERYKKKPRNCISCGELSELGHNVYCHKCKDNILTCEPHHRIYFGKKFYKNDQGYWICTTKSRLWAHRWVWISHHGKIPPKMDIHHIDEDKSNNEIENLQMVNRSDHLKIHWQDEDAKAKRREFLSEIRHLAHKVQKEKRKLK